MKRTEQILKQLFVCGNIVNAFPYSNDASPMLSKEIDLRTELFDYFGLPQVEEYLNFLYDYIDGGLTIDEVILKLEQAKAEYVPVELNSKVLDEAFGSVLNENKDLLETMARIGVESSSYLVYLFDNLGKLNWDLVKEDVLLINSKKILTLKIATVEESGMGNKHYLYPEIKEEGVHFLDLYLDQQKEKGLVYGVVIIAEILQVSVSESGFLRTKCLTYTKPEPMEIVFKVEDFVDFLIEGGYDYRKFAHLFQDEIYKAQSGFFKVIEITPSEDLEEQWGFSGVGFYTLVDFLDGSHEIIERAREFDKDNYGDRLSGLNGHLPKEVQAIYSEWKTKEMTETEIADFLGVDLFKIKAIMYKEPRGDQAPESIDHMATPNSRKDAYDYYLYLKNTGKSLGYIAVMLDLSWEDLESIIQEFEPKF